MSSSLVTFSIIVVFITCQLHDKAKGMVCDEITRCNDRENVSCIEKYQELHAYILCNQDLLDQLTEAFYRTGKDSAQFVRIIYNFQVSISNISDENYDMIEDKSINCLHNSELYIWSTSSIYLLGPKALVSLSLFTINIVEYGVSIQLPCLCENAYGKLLSRLTYLVI